MNTFYKLISLTVFLLFLTSCNTNLKNSKTVTVEIAGNCGMCETKIEKAGSKKKEAIVDWNMETKTAEISFNSAKTSKEEILKRIADAGYDNELYKAPDSTYNKLAGCCKYRNEEEEHDHSSHSHGDHDDEHIYMAAKTEADDMPSIGFNVLFYTYFKIKENLTNSDHDLAANYAGSMYRAIGKIDPEKLEEKQQLVWLSLKAEVLTDAEGIANAKEIAQQRAFLSSLSLGVFNLMKLAKPDVPVHLFNCLEWAKGSGGNWISKEKEFDSNPFYGKEKSCGRLIQSISK